MRMRRGLLKPMLLLFSIVLVVGVPVFLLLIALSDAIDASPKPMLVISYAFAGGLAALLLWVSIRLVRLRRRTARRPAYSSTYLDVAELRSEVSIALGMMLNLGYAAFKFGAAAHYRTLLFAAEAFYYLVLFGIRMLLVFNAYTGRRYGSRASSSWKGYRRCGWQLLILELSMSFVILQSLKSRVDYISLTAAVYGSALWAFYRLSAAIVQLIRVRGADRPFLSASKVLNLSAALMSIYVLQNTLLLHFNGDEAFRLRMNLGFGLAISLTVIALAVFMIVHATGRLAAAQPTPPASCEAEPDTE